MSRPVSFPAVAAGAYAAVAALAVHPPSDAAAFCPFRMLTGIRCPGCGMGHALVHAMRGEFALSFRFHPLGIPLLILWTAWLGWGAFNLSRGREFSNGFLPVLRRPVTTWALLVLVLGVYAVRMAARSS